MATRHRRRHRPTRVLATSLLVATAVGATHATPPASADVCPTTIDADDFADAAALRSSTKVMDDLGPRPTASPAQLRYIDSIERRLRRVDGLSISEMPEEIDLQLERSSSLHVSDGDGSRSLPLAGAVPYAEPTTGARGPLVHVPEGTAIADRDVTGAVVVRKATTAAIPYAVFAAVAWYVHDPDLSIDPLADYERDNLGYLQRVTDLREAAEGGAAAVVFVHDFPRPQVTGHYAPYEGERWHVPAVYVGVDEGTELIQRARTGAHATVRTTSERRTATTRNLVATLPGRSDERIVVQSHTDGMNAVWDNGPAAMLALIDYFAELPAECRSRTLQFVFTTAHLHLSKSGAYRFAAMLDEEYESGTVALVVAIEHLGAREFTAVPRTDGPGRRLEATGQSELFVAFAMESPVLIEILIDRIRAHDLRRSFLLRGADAPQVGFPPHRSFGGEGGPYREHLIPTVAGITGPWTLYNPAFAMDDLIDFELMRRQTLAYGDLMLAVDELPREVIAGGDNVYRFGRDLLGADPLGDATAHRHRAGS